MSRTRLPIATTSSLRGFCRTFRNRSGGGTQTRSSRRTCLSLGARAPTFAVVLDGRLIGTGELAEVDTGCMYRRRDAGVRHRARMVGTRACDGGRSGGEWIGRSTPSRSCAVWASTDVANTRSRRACSRKLGFRCEGCQSARITSAATGITGGRSHVRPRRIEVTEIAQHAGDIGAGSLAKPR